VRVLVSGASGLIGRALIESLEDDGVVVVRLVRRPARGEAELSWDPTRDEIDPVDGFDAVVHLAGAGIGDKRWSESRKKEILNSRVQGTRLLARALAKAAAKPAVFITASAIGYYGDRPDNPVDEDSGPADPPDYLSTVCVAWEEAAAAAENAGIRTVPIRTGLVLASGGGALGKMLLPFRLGLGGRIGSGDTWWSWISITDQIRAIRHLIDRPVAGPVNLTAPNPVRSRDLTKALGRVLRRPALIPIPRLVLEVLLGKELATALLFTSARVQPVRLLESGFEFTHTDVESALRDVL